MMSDKVSNFFQNLRNDDDLFLFYRLYNNPNSVLGDKQKLNEVEEEYLNLFNYYDLMLNNNLTEFILAVYFDDDFRKRTNLYNRIWTKFNFFLFDSIDFKKYSCISKDKNLIDVIEDRMYISDYLKTNRPPYALFEVKEAWTKYKKLFDYGYSDEKIELYNEKRANLATLYTNIVIGIINEKEFIKRKKEKYFKKISQNTFDCANSLNEINCEVLDFLVCENKYLNIIDKIIQDENLNEKLIDNIINIINIGIKIKKHIIPNTGFYIRKIDDKQIEEFDLELAKMLIKKLNIYKKECRQSQKIIKLEFYK